MGEVRQATDFDFDDCLIALQKESYSSLLKEEKMSWFKHPIKKYKLRVRIISLMQEIDKLEKLEEELDNENRTTNTNN